MLNLFFNPYTGIAEDEESGEKCLLATANACKEISEDTDLSVYGGDETDSVQTFTLAHDDCGAWLRPSSFIRKYSGREKDLIIWFLRLFDKGKRLCTEDFSGCEDWIIKDLNLSAPILEYAARQDGMALTITDDADWKLDFFCFHDISNKLPNLHGQEDCSLLHTWIKEWFARHMSFKKILESEYNVTFCKGAVNTCFPSRSEEQGVIHAFEGSKDMNYQIDNNLIKPFRSNNGNILELRSYGDGVRIFFTLNSGIPIIGGFYRKSSAISQNKAGENAIKRLKKEGFV